MATWNQRPRHVLNTALGVLGLATGLLNAAIVARADVPAVQLPVTEMSRAIRAAVGTGAAASGPITPKERAQLTALYDAGSFAPLWVDADGDPTRDARAALTVIAHAAEEGLEPSDYRGGAVQDLATALAGATTRQAADIAQFDVGLSASTLRYFSHVHIGRVDPRSIGFRMTAPADEHDFGALLRSALAEHRLAETAASLTPPLALYRGLRATLAQYRALAADPTLGLSTSFVASVKPGEPYIGVTALRRLLVALGDLPANAGGRVESSVYEGVLVDGVRHFQLRHGLEADGILGKATQTALGVPLSRRVRQIRARARAAALAAAPRRPVPCGQHPDVPSLGMGRLSSQSGTFARHGHHRRARAEPADAGIRGGDEVHHLPAVLERPSIDRPRGGGTRTQARPRLSTPAGHGDRVRSW